MIRIQLCALLALVAEPAAGPPDATLVHGMTISCHTWGKEWGSDEFARELDDLRALGVNWVAIHPYASIKTDGHVEWRALDPAEPPAWIARPIREAHARGMSVLVIPHIAYWGSPWSWRGDIELNDPEARARFFSTYTRFLADVASCAAGADGFSIGNELDKLVVHEKEWRGLIATVRAKTGARLTYASDWSAYERVPFWDALDAVGVEAYFPICESDEPTPDSLRSGWRNVLAAVKRIHERTGKPVVFTELGYNCSLDAARKPWAYPTAKKADRERAEKLQATCLEIALESIAPQSEWLRGAFLWKWFVGDARGENFLMNTPALRAVIGRAWGQKPR